MHPSFHLTANDKSKGGRRHATRGVGTNTEGGRTPGVFSSDTRRTVDEKFDEFLQDVGWIYVYKFAHKSSIRCH